ncbi:Mg-chelatase subunit ChlD [Bradyrhizobium japonicum USDA 38]|nr:Mg-chelatase subunit ChlD [Bradyrhizobium japonicum USDA 38]MCS3948566.1 Mg-chelatase subunit ChlD [Bradyrhizobium japonicum]MCS3977343.1 Mg-chelatase subunit ChlD [Bradyrhizobium japonicum]
MPEAMPRAKSQAADILRKYHKAETELIGKAVVLTDGKAGTVEGVHLDEAHGLRLSIAGHPGKWPISTIKLVQK